MYSYCLMHSVLAINCYLNITILVFCFLIVVYDEFDDAVVQWLSVMGRNKIQFADDHFFEKGFLLAIWLFSE